MTDPTRPPLPDPAGLEPTMSPVDLPGDAPGEDRPLRWTATIVAVATLFLLFFNAGAIRSWANELRPGPTTEPVIAAADAWHGVTAAIGLARPVETMRGWWEAAKAARFGGQDAAVPEPEAPATRQPRPGERGPTTS